ncbi:olfactory receptor 10A6-like [Pygocentrus nattereri]|uniref:olfactory receptor 10A6-like n=1 Tax=Pygocentrus nattereri TaxID=42514 RepID=UPI0008146577|nr:olfactory receptor 10A6-like [Pygocentrus nattereri]
MLNLNITLIFMAYGAPGPLNFGVFFVTLVTYLATMFANIILMLLIYYDTSLHKPMYIFLFNLAMNGLIGSSAVLPNIMSNLVNNMKNISYNNCLLQVFFINFYASCAYGILTVMAYDRYVSICKPLQYHNIMTPAKVRLLIGAVYIFPMWFLAVQLYFTSMLPLCRYTINKLFCDNLAVVSLACLKSALVDLYGLVGVVFFVVFPLALVIMSYVRILFVSLKASANAKKKALKTCAPHLITFINFSSASLFSVIYNRFSNYLPKELNVFMSIHFILIPPLLHPLIYGMRTESIIKSLRKSLQKRIFAFEFHLKSEDNIKKSAFSCLN